MPHQENDPQNPLMKKDPFLGLIIALYFPMKGVITRKTHEKIVFESKL